MTEFKLSRKATEDLQGIWVYTSANWSRTRADKYIHVLENACKMLADHPARGRNYELISENYLGYRVEKHIIFCRVVSPDEITIVRILYGGMDLENRIRE